MKRPIDEYSEKYHQLTTLLQDNVPRSLRLFNIRFRLSIDIIIDFRGITSLTKTTEVKQTYVLIIRLMETWNSYEALTHYVKELSVYPTSKENISRLFSQTLLNKIGALNILKDKLDTLKSFYKNNPQFNQDFTEYISRIKNEDRIKKTLTEDCLSVLEYFDDKKTISGIEILALIYAERNMYYHNGETAKMGMRYNNRKKLINTYLDCLEEYILIFINYVMTDEIKKIR